MEKVAGDGGVGIIGQGQWRLLLVVGREGSTMSHRVYGWGGSKDAKCAHDGSDTSELGLLDH